MEERLDPQEDEYLRRQEMALGAEATALLERNGALHRAFEAIKDDIWDKFRNCDPSDAAGLQIVRLKIELLEELQGEIKRIRETGQLAEVQLDRMREDRRREARQSDEGDYDA